jgi:hypothetical protein
MPSAKDSIKERLARYRQIKLSVIGRTFPPRGSRCFRFEPPQHLHDPRNRQARKPVVHRHGVP